MLMNRVDSEGDTQLDELSVDRELSRALRSDETGLLVREPTKRIGSHGPVVHRDLSDAMSGEIIVPESGPAVELTGVEIGAPLGVGGMAVVRRGQQLKLDREVAVKVLRDELASDDNVESLLNEARITARLEHPNIVPVHDVVRGPDGLPRVVLKLIDGHTWSQLMAEPGRVRDQFAADDLLEWNISVLMSVCRAVSFAHSRGVLHRDIKVNNVMVGQFGEVYLLDWGIALEVRETAPHVAEAGSPKVTGTLPYMAPEQLEGDLSRLGPWTDTYLLGATLYHVLVGRAVHAGKPHEVRCSDVIDALPPPALPEHVPVELAEIVRRALDPDATTRTQDPESFRRELADFLRHRAANRLVERGGDAWMRGRMKLTQDAPEEAQCLFLAAEIALRTALDEWPECDEAQRALSELALERIKDALSSGNPHVAARLAETHEQIPDALRSSVAAAVAAADEEAERLRTIAAAADRRVGHRARGVFGAVFGTIWFVWWSWVAFSPPQTVWPLVGVTLAYLVLGIAFIATQARTLWSHRINRSTMLVIGAALLLMIVWCIGASWQGLSVRQVQIGLLLVWALAISAVSLNVDLRGIPAVLGFTVAFLVASYEPSWTPWAVVLSNLALVANQIGLNLFLSRRGWGSPTETQVTRPH